MRGISNFDLPARLAPAIPRLAVEALTALLCVGVAGVARPLLEIALPGVAPFVLAAPALLLATTLAGWRAGLLALALLGLVVWYAVLPPRFAFGPLNPGDAANLAAQALSGLMVIALGEVSRAGWKRAEQARAETAAAGDLLLRELNHRVKNNFQVVAGLLDMQRRTSKEPATAEALESVIRRVHSLAQAHEALYAPAADMRRVDFARYLEDLCRSLSGSLILNTLVQLKCSSAPVTMSPDRTAALGLVINELVTNAVKHAFPDGRAGAIQVDFASTEVGWRLTVADDGVGVSRKTAGAGIGRRLVEAFARQAGGVLSEGPGPGATVRIDLPFDAAVPSDTRRPG